MAFATSWERKQTTKQKTNPKTQQNQTKKPQPLLLFTRELEHDVANWNGAVPYTGHVAEP